MGESIHLAPTRKNMGDQYKQRTKNFGDKDQQIEMSANESDWLKSETTNPAPKNDKTTEIDSSTQQRLKSKHAAKAAIGISCWGECGLLLQKLCFGWGESNQLKTKELLSCRSFHPAPLFISQALSFFGRSIKQSGWKILFRNNLTQHTRPFTVHRP